VADIIGELKSYGIEVFVHDPAADPEEALHEYGVQLSAWDDLPRADAVIAAVAHSEYLALGSEDLARRMVKGGCFIDVKAMFDKAMLEAAGVRVWRL
jgi:UDP-N-acetyl-D-galactosamine dehydrogenase